MTSPSLWGGTLEEMAAAQHEIWAHWMKYMLAQGELFYNRRNGTVDLILPVQQYERWNRQMNTPYTELSEQEKESDRQVVQQFIGLLLR